MGTSQPLSSYMGMCRPTGSCFWDSDLEQHIIFKPFSRTGCNIVNPQKLQNAVLTVEHDIKKLVIFKNRVSLRSRTLS